MSSTATKNAKTKNNMNEQDQASLKNAAAEIADDVVLARKLAADAKAKGWKVALTENAPAIVAELKEDIAAARAAAPIVKAGYKTSEFWIVVVAIVGVVGAHAIGKPLPWQESLIIGTLAGAYALVRGFVKK